MAAVQVVVFDVNETLSDLAPLATRFTDLGLPAGATQAWFAGVLRDGFALAVHAEAERFVSIGAAILRGMLPPGTSEADLAAAVDHVVGGFTGLGVHPDVVEGVRALRARGLRLVTLSNGSASIAESLLTRAGLRDEFDLLLSVDDAGVWKPAQEAYWYAATVCGVDLASMLMVAVHPWDLDGASRAGMSTAWLNRSGVAYPDHFRAPTVSVATLPELADALPE